MSMDDSEVWNVLNTVPTEVRQIFWYGYILALIDDEQMWSASFKVSGCCAARKAF